MLCQSCGKNEAVFHYKSSINGNVTEQHLCRDCAAALGAEKKENFIAHVQGAPCANFGKVIDPNCAEPSIINAGEMII